MILMAALFLAGADAAGPVLQLGHAGAPVALRIAVRLEGKPAGHDWDFFLDRLFAHADGNGDGVLTAAEARHALPISGPEGKVVALEFARADGDGNGQVSRQEFRAFYRQRGFLPVATLYRPPSAETTRLAAALFSHLDRNGDGRISGEEWKGAPGLMARFDENEDEILQPEELLANGLANHPAQTVSDRELASPWGSGSVEPDTTLGIDLGERPAAKLDAIRMWIRSGASPSMLEVPGGKVRIKLEPSDPVKSFRSSTREFFLAQFADAAGKKRAMKRSELEADPSLAAILALFDSADRNDDGVMSVAELEALFDLVELGLSRQAALILENRGQNLFDWLDENGDGRLDLGELNRARHGEPLDRKDIPWSYRLIAARGPAENRFGLLRVPLGGQPAALAKSAGKGPAWFQAMDKNQDGFVSASEFRGRPEAFDRLDRDQDGRISVQEAQEARR